MNENYKTEIELLNSDLKKELEKILKTNGNYKEEVTHNNFKEILKYKPVTLDEMYQIINLSDELIDAYGERIVAIFDSYISNFLTRNDFLNRITPSTREAMEVVYFRNVHVNKNNHLLLRNKKIENEIFLNNQSEVVKSNVLNQYLKLKDFYNEDIELTEGIVNVSKFYEQAESFVEKYDKSVISQRHTNLYVSYGSITGKLTEGEKELKIDAPALFVPVKFKINFEGEFYLIPDFGRKIKINEDIVIASNNFDKENTKIDYEAFDEILNLKTFNEKEIVKQLLQFYTDNNVAINIEKKPKTLLLKNEIALGFYDVYKNATQVDLEEILNNGFITDNIEKMFSIEEDISKKDELSGTMNDEAQKLRQKLIDDREYEVSYITKINFPQDRAIKGSKVYENIVIQGPPGTGKTEVITSIISDAVLRGKKLLVSSEKLVAIDVIKARLMELSKYAVLFNQDMLSADFYEQITTMITESTKDRANQRNSSIQKSDNEIIFNRNEARIEIIDYMKDYQVIFEYLKQNEIGKTYSWLYKNHSGYRANESEINEILTKSTIVDIIKQNRLFVPKLYDVLYMLNQKFSTSANVSEFDVDKAALSRYPFLLTHTKRSLSTRKIQQTLLSINEAGEEELFIGNAFSKKASKILSKVFVDVKHLSTYIKNKAEMLKVVELLNIKVMQITNEIEDETDTNTIFNSLGSAWSNTFDQIVELYYDRGKKVNAKVISNVIFDDTIKKILELKEASNTELQRNITNGNISAFNKMISKNLSDIVEKNITLTGRKLRDALLDKLIESNKMLEIQSWAENQKNRPVNEFMNEYWKEIFESVNIWLLPSETVPNFFPLVPKMFDTVIIDEASQMMVQKAIPLLYRAKRLIISGDDKQLKPSVNPNELIYVSPGTVFKNNILPPLGLQDALKNKYANYLLNYHYRSKFAELISFSNTFFYNRSLYISTPKAYTDENPPVQFKKVKGKYVGGKNAVEATRVIKEVVNLIKEDDTKTIGLIAFTIKQREMLIEKLKAEADKNPILDLYIRTNSFSTNGEDTSLFVKNVSEVQGDERDIILFSTAFAANDKGELPSSLGDISLEHGENRLNVAVTRAKEKIVVVSSINPNDITVDVTDRGGGLLKQFLYYAQAFETNNKNTIRNILKQKRNPETKIFESRMHEEIFNVIRSAGYNVDYQFGFDDYIVDFVIKNEKGDIVLGINLDNEQYLRNFNTMEREYYLPTYLEARGWNMMKIWSHQWSKNPDIENQLIIERIEESIKAFEQGSILSPFENGHVSLDFNVEDDSSNNMGIEKDIIKEGEDIISDRYKEIRMIAKKIMSEKNEAEEQKWLKEYESLEKNNAKDVSDEIGRVLDREFRENTKVKLYDGIEETDIEELSNLTTKKRGDD